MVKKAPDSDYFLWVQFRVIHQASARATGRLGLSRLGLSRLSLWLRTGNTVCLDQRWADLIIEEALR